MTTSAGISFPVLPELEKLLLTDEMDHETVSKITREPRPLDNYSVVDNIYHYFAPSPDNLLRALEILHRNLLNDTSIANNSSNANGLHSLPRQLLPFIADYGHSQYFWEEIIPIHPRYSVASRIGKVVNRHVEDGKGNKCNLILHGPQVTTYFEDSVPHVVRRLFLFGKPIIEEDIVVPHERRVGEKENVVNAFVPRVFSVRLLSAANEDRGYVGYGFEHSTDALMRFDGVKLDKRSFEIVRPPTDAALTFLKCQLLHLDLSPLDPVVYHKPAK